MIFRFPRPPGRPRSESPSKSWRKRLALAIFGVVLACALAELGAWIFIRYIASERDFLRYASMAQLRERHGGPQFQTHRHLGYCLTPNYRREVPGKSGNRHNSLGFRGDEFSIQKTPGLPRIVCVGGSTTYGWGVADDYYESYPAILQELLAERGAPAQVINAGTPGWTTLEQLINFETRILDLEPDYVVVYLGVNDVMPRIVWPPAAYRSDLAGWLRRDRHVTRAPLFEWSNLGRLLMVRFGGLPPQGAIDRIIGDRPVTARYFEFLAQRRAGRYPSGVFAKVPVERMLATNQPVYFERNLRNLTTLAEAHGIRLVLTTFAFASGFTERPMTGHPAARAAMRETNAIIRRIAEETAAGLFDLAELIPDDDSLYTDGIHFTARANRIRAELLIEHGRIGR